MDDPAQQEDLQVLLSRVPAPVREFITVQLPTAAQKLGEKFHLHVDQVGTLEFELLLMLLGKKEPAAFVTTLQDAGLPRETVQGILADVNAEIFTPLRAAEQHGPAPVPAAPPISSYQAPAERPVPEPLAPAPRVEMPTVPPPAPAPVPAYQTIAQVVERTAQAGAMPVTPPEIPAAPHVVPIPPAGNAPSDAPIERKWNVDPYREPPE